MDDFYGQCSDDPRRSGSPSDDDILLASTTPKKKAGRKKFKETRHPVYRGVRQRNGNRWVCEVRTPNNNSRIWLGTHPTAEMAARAHDVAALALRGRNACLNFADSAWRLPVPVSIDTGDIQRAAAEAAELFRPAELLVESTTQESSGYVYENEVGVGTSLSLSSSNNTYMDEEALFNMPRLIDNMAQGMLLPPPRNAWGWDDNNNDSECEISLWNY